MKRKSEDRIWVLGKANSADRNEICVRTLDPVDSLKSTDSSEAFQRAGCNKQVFQKTLKILNPASSHKLVGGKPEKKANKTPVKSISEEGKKLTWTVAAADDPNKRKKKKGNVDADRKSVELKTEKQASSESVSGTVKKHKSFDYIDKVSFSGAALAQKVSNVLRQLKNQKPISELDLFRGYLKSPEQRKPNLGVLDKYSWNQNLFPGTKKLTDREGIPGKSLSHDCFNYHNGTRPVNRFFSFENGKIKEYPKTLDDRKNLKPPQKPDDLKMQYHNVAYPPYHCPRGLPRNPQEGFNERDRVWRFRSQENKPESGYHPCYVQLYPGNVYDGMTLESLVSGSKESVKAADPEKNGSKSELNVKLCQCPHYHSEDGIKNISIQNCNSATEYGKKFFRLNYLSKDDDEDQEEEKEYEDKGTSMEPEMVKEVKKKSKEPEKVARKPSAQTKISSSTKGKTLSRKPDKPKVVLWHDDNQMQILGESSRKKEETKKPKPSSRDKPRKVPQTKKKSGSMEDKSKEEDNRLKMLEELSLLEKLFGKLNSLERVSRRRKLTLEGKFSGRTEDNRTKSNLEKYVKSLLVENEAEEEYQSRRRKLRTAIIQHIQDWLKLDYVAG